MTEQSVILLEDGVAKITELRHRLTFGYMGNRNVYCFRVVPTGIWEGLTIRAHWHLDSGETVASTLLTEEVIRVPAAVTENAGRGCITFEGSDGTKTLTSADVEWLVKRNSGTDDGTMPEPNTPAWESFLEELRDGYDLEIGTVSVGEEASAEIVNGKLNLVIPKGEEGPKGDTPDEKKYTLIETITLLEDTRSVVRTKEPDGTPLNLSDVYILFNGPVYTENRQIIVNVGNTSNTGVWTYDRLAYFTMAMGINTKGQSFAVYCERYRGLWRNYCVREAVGNNGHGIVPMVAEGTVKSVRIFAYDNTTNLIPEGTVIEIWGVRDDS